ncbi:MAG: translocation/assembly module TamB domain-containing protein, partial [Gemmatimonadaceae bacterium]|nr:translocation/assembly module TamB domain-containing protein [Gemmatimonadaceae bacterium]
RVHIGRIGGNLVTGLSIDSLELRDDEDSLVVATGRIALAFDARDFASRRLYFSRVEVAHAQVVLRQHQDWQWNFKRLFRVGREPQAPPGPEGGFGDFIVADSVRLTGNASLRVTIPWHPDDSLHGARRDSAIRANLAYHGHEVRRTREGLTQTYRWTNGYVVARHARIAHPDSAGQSFVIDTMHTDETVPPFRWRNVAGRVRVLGDSAWLDASHWDLPASTGHAAGKVVWGSDLPVRYALRITGDSVSLRDVAWVYPTLPRTGSGRMVLTIANERKLELLDYAITEMDLRTTGSRLRGRMTFETGGRVLAVHDVKLLADPVDFDLLRTLNGGPFPADWRGTLTGTVNARGGPVTNFIVDAADLTFRDFHVPGATSTVHGAGELDILYPALTAFHRFHARTDRLDLRTLQAVYPDFPALRGFVSGSAVLDSSWLDVRVSDASIAHTDGPGASSTFTGGGRVTYGDQFIAYDLAVLAAPVSFTTLARSYPNIGLRGTMSGTIHVKGTAPSLAVEADLTGTAGHLTYSGTADADETGGLGGRGSGRFDHLDAAVLLGVTGPPSTLAGGYDVDVVGDSIATLVGPFGIRLERSEVDGLHVAAGVLHGRFDTGLLRLDSARVDGAPGALRASGALGLTRSAGRDSLSVAVDIDSLGGLRRYLKRDAAGGAVVNALDSIGGSMQFRGVVRGSLDSMDVRGTLLGHDVALRGSRARTIRGSLAMRTRAGLSAGAVTLRADSVIAAGVRLSLVNAGAALLDRDHARFSASATGSGLASRLTGEWLRAGGSATTRIDTLDLALGDTSRWALAAPARLTTNESGTRLDSLVLRDGGNGRVTATADLPLVGAVRARLAASDVALGDLGRVAALSAPIGGRLSTELLVSGTRARPVLALDGTAVAPRYAGLNAEAVRVTARYADERATLDAGLLRGGRSILDATVSYPVALTLFSARVTEDSLRGRVHADSVDLALVETLSSKVRNATGRLALDLALSGRAARPHFGGSASISGGALDVPGAGISIGALDGALRVDAASDSLSIDGMRWTSPANDGTASLQGSLVFRDIDNPRLALRLDARGLRAIDKRGLARLDVSTGIGGLTLAGNAKSATLTGAVNVDRGTIFIPELVRKRVEELSLDEFAQLFDTTDVRNRSLMPQPPSALVEHLRLEGVSVRLGEEVWLKSREANIKLGGTLNLTRALDTRQTIRSSLARGGRGEQDAYKLALAGTLSADRGTYTLDLTAVQREFQVESGRITFFG